MGVHGESFLLFSPVIIVYECLCVYVDLTICIIYRARHLMTDVRMLLPHSRAGTCIYTVKSNIVCIHLCRQVWESNFKHVGKNHY